MPLRTLVLEEDPSERFKRAGLAIEDALSVIAGIRAKTKNPSLDERLGEVSTSIGVVFDVLAGLKFDLASLVEALPDNIEIEIGEVGSRHTIGPGRGASAPALDAVAARRSDRTNDQGAREPVGDTHGPQSGEQSVGAACGTADRGDRAEVEGSPASPGLPRFEQGDDSASAENSGPLKRTDEQDAVVFSNESVLAINAGAGTGKTSTLIEYANYRERTRFLYLAFNRAIADEAQRKFGKNVVAKTSHSLAFGRVGRDYANKLGNPRARDVQELLLGQMRLPVSGNADEYVFAQAALNRVRDFFAEGSLNPEIVDQEGVIEMPSGVEVDGSRVGEAARHLWEAMCDRSNMAIRLPHDGYLKLWQLTKPDLSRLCDTLLLDEAQDTNPCLLSVVNAQRTGRVLVGDRHQSIYGFRGATNAMSKVRGAKAYYLTKSFRFGPNVAFVANSILSVFCNERKRLIGAGRKSLEEDPSTAHLYRTNAGLFGGAVDWLDANGPRDEFGQPRKSAGEDPVRGLHFVGGVEGYQFDIIADTWHMREGALGLVQDGFLRKFASYEQLAQYADAVQDRELLARIGIVDKYTNRIPELVRKVKAAHVDASRAALNLATAHRAKGLEWGTVRLGPDFPELLSETGVPRIRRFLGSRAQDSEVLPVEEANLLYVASTRARCVLQQNQAVSDFLDWCRVHSGEMEERAEEVVEGAGA
jgi:F-box protein 18 (helicase)